MTVKIGFHKGCGGEVSVVTPMGIGKLYNHCDKCKKTVGHNEIIDNPDKLSKEVK